MGRERRRASDALVVDHEKRFVEYVSAAVARKLLKEGYAAIERKSPFTLRLPPGQRTVPALTSWTPRKEMHVQQNIYAHPHIPNAINWMKFFEEERDIWLQNISDVQISLDIEIGPGQTYPKVIPLLPDPICITNEIGFDMLKKSSNFKKMMNKRKNGKPLLIPLTEEQVAAYWRAKAKRMGSFEIDPRTGLVARDENGEPIPNVHAAQEAADGEYRRLTTRQTVDEVNAGNLYGFSPPKSAQELIAMDMANRGIVQGQHGLASAFTHALTPEQAQHMFQQRQGYMPPGAVANLGGRPLMMDEIVHPQILNLCNQVGAHVPPGQGMSEADLSLALERLAPALNIESFQHIESHGWYRGIKTWARRQIADRFPNEEGPADLSMQGQAQLGMAERGRPVAEIPRTPQVLQFPQGMGPQGPAAVGVRGEVQYQGPIGFANAPGAAGMDLTGMNKGLILGPDGKPLET